MVAGAKRSRTQAGLVEEIRNCVNEFPEEAADGKIRELPDFVRFCTHPESVDKLVHAIACNEDMQSLINTIDVADPAAQKLRTLVSAVTAEIGKYLHPALKLLQSSLIRTQTVNEDATVVTKDAGDVPPGIFKSIWKLAKVCKAFQP